MKAILNNNKEIVIVMNRAEVASIGRALSDAQDFNQSMGYKYIAKHDEEMCLEFMKFYKEAFDK